jgi:diguanylate cyclase (GGDEF)-like protein/PAS domain S-box-containing protein
VTQSIAQSESLAADSAVARCTEISGDTRPVVLVVDDERTNREILSRMLVQSGYDVLTSDNGESALDRIEEQLPDLILLDVNMPGISGFDVLKSIRARYRDTELPVLIVTADTERDSVVNAFHAGANDYITKPLDKQITIARVSLQMRLRGAQIELKRSQERYALAAQGSRIGLWDWDIPRRQIFLSARWKEMLGYSDNELHSTVDVWFERIHSEDRESFTELLTNRGTLELGRFESEIRMRHRDGSYRWMLCSGVVQTNNLGTPVRLAGSLADVTEGKVRDVLTGLPNRLLFEEQLSQVVQIDPTVGGLCAVLFLDLDNFKLVNDSLGHDAGDLLLCSVARKLEGCLRTSDVISRNKSAWSVARHGGDEFTVLLHRLNDRRDAEQVAERIISALSEPVLIGTRELLVGVSVGIAFGGHKSAADAIREADTAMYYAKTAGRRQYRIFSPEMQSEAAARLALECDLRNAIRNQEFYLAYQPIVRIASGIVDGFEALCRWHHPSGKEVGPDSFIPVIESQGMIGKLGRMVLEMASAQMMEWNEFRLNDGCGISVTVNCSSGEFSLPHFKNDLLLTLARIGADPRLLRIEVTESTLMKNPDHVRRIIHDLRETGIRVGIDDFGTGYSSLAYLHRLPLDVLKIDKSFVHNMHSCSETREIVRTIIALGQNLDLDIVAEGVETRDQQQTLFEMGCTHAQGYLYSRPIPAETISEFLHSYHPIPAQLAPSSTRAEIEARLQHAEELLAQPE